MKFFSILKEYSVLILMAIFTGLFMGLRGIRIEKHNFIIFIVVVIAISLCYVFYKWIKLMWLISRGKERGTVRYMVTKRER